MSSLRPTYSNWLDRWMFTSFPMSAEAMGLYRIFFALSLLIWGVPNIEWITNTPDGFFNPPTYSLSALFSGFPPYWFLQGLSLLTAVLCLMLLFGWHTRRVSIGLFVTVVVAKSFMYSFGTIKQDMIVWLVPLLMSFTNWGSAFSIDSQKANGVKVNNNIWPVTMIAFILSFGMVSAGLPKLLGGWLDVSTHATRGHFFTQYYVIGDLKFLANWLVTVINPLLWEAMDWGAVLFEMLFLAVAFKPRLLRIWILLAVAFHTITFLTFNISFHFQYIVYLLFIDWGKIRPMFYERFGHITKKVFTLKGLVLAIVVYLPLYILSQKLTIQPATLAPSPFIMATDLLGFDYNIVMGVTALIPTYIVVIWQLSTKPSTATS